MSQNAETLKNKIIEMPGNKIVTLLIMESPDSTKEVKYDISSEREIGYSKEHEEAFFEQLENAINTGGALVIRQFTEIYNDNIPIKKLYGVRLGQGTFLGIDKDELKQSFSVDADTGKPIEPPANVQYCDFK